MCLLYRWVVVCLYLTSLPCAHHRLSTLLRKVIMMFVYSPFSQAYSVPDKFTMRSSQTLNLAKKGNHVSIFPFLTSLFLTWHVTMRSSQTLNLAKKGNHVCLFFFLTSLFPTWQVAMAHHRLSTLIRKVIMFLYSPFSKAYFYTWQVYHALILITDSQPCPIGFLPH